MGITSVDDAYYMIANNNQTLARLIEFSDSYTSLLIAGCA